MKLSHSKLSTILDCPATYYLSYIQKIRLKKEKSALAIGSAVHWGIEHDTEDLTDYYGLEHNYGRDEWLAESMVHGYLRHKDEIFKQILTKQDGSALELVDENHELFVESNLKSFKFDTHQFVGIIDLLLLTNEGFIIIDYKTSSQIPDWDKYLDQIYRYIFLLKNTFPDVPIVKIGIINLRKTMIRQKKNENEEQYIIRLKNEYDINDENLINYHEYLPEDLDENLINNYINNLSKMADMAQLIDESKNFYINFKNANGMYGKSDYWDIFYNTPDCEYLYSIEDKIYNENYDGSEYYIETIRDCNKLDMKILESNNIINHYDDFKKMYIDALNNNPKMSINHFVKNLKNNYLIDSELLCVYANNILIEKKYGLFTNC